MPQDEKLTDGEVQAELDSLPEWELYEGALRRRFTFKDFPDALTFVVRVGLRLRQRTTTRRSWSSTNA